MDVLRPPMVYIDGRCYRKNPVLDQDVDKEYHDDRMSEEDENMYEDEVCDAFTNIEETAHGYRIRLNIPSTFFKYIIGKKAETKRRLENETRTQIKVPKAGEEGEIVIDGRDKKGVVSAKTRIDVMVDSARQRQPFTHFLSLPVNDPDTQNNFEDFKEEVLRQCDGDRGLDASLFQRPAKLHITIGTLVLLSDPEITQANQVLQDCKQDIVGSILGGQPMVIELSELEYMNDDPGDVDVLYIKVKAQDGSNRLQELADTLVNRFTSAGLMSPQYDHVKLHITAMNTLFRKDPSGVAQPQYGDQRVSVKDRESFDASDVLRKFGAHYFGVHLLDSIHLSQRYSTGSDGYYVCSAQLPLK